MPKIIVDAHASPAATAAPAKNRSSPPPPSPFEQSGFIESPRASPKGVATLSGTNDALVSLRGRGG